MVGMRHLDLDVFGRVFRQCTNSNRPTPEIHALPFCLPDSHRYKRYTSKGRPTRLSQKPYQISFWASPPTPPPPRAPIRGPPPPHPKPKDLSEKGHLTSKERAEEVLQVRVSGAIGWEGARRGSTINPTISILGLLSTLEGGAFTNQGRPLGNKEGTKHFAATLNPWAWKDLTINRVGLFDALSKGACALVARCFDAGIAKKMQSAILYNARVVANGCLECVTRDVELYWHQRKERLQRSRCRLVRLKCLAVQFQYGTRNPLLASQEVIARKLGGELRGTKQVGLPKVLSFNFRVQEVVEQLACICDLMQARRSHHVNLFQNFCIGSSPGMFHWKAYERQSPSNRPIFGK